MQTRFASGRVSLPAPIITVGTGGAIQGNNATYYFWIKAKNRGGFNQPSSVTSLVIPNNSKLTIAASNFVQFSYEDWREFYIIASTSNSFSNGKVIFRQSVYNTDQVTLLSLSSSEFNNSLAITGNGILASATDLPTSNLSNGMRFKIADVNKVFEYNSTSNAIADGISVINALQGRWLLITTNTLIPDVFTADRELYEVPEDDLELALTSTGFSFPAIKYYIVNNDGNPLLSAELDLNPFVSDKSLKLSFKVKILGYINLSSYVLDITGIGYVNSTVDYPATEIQLTKALPQETALIIEVTPDIDVNNLIYNGTYISLYPKLNDYTFVDEITYFSTPLANIADLKAIPLSIVKDKQARYVESKRNFYVYDSSSTIADNGDTVLIPNSAPSIGRWLLLVASIDDESITPAKLSSDTLALIDNSITTTSITINTSIEYNLDLDSQDFDYFIITTPTEDGNVTTIDVTATLSTNSTKSIAIELRQRTGLVEFDNSLLFPGGIIPGLSGAGKTDLFVVVLTRDTTTTIKKRIYISQKDIG